ncbi:hypothetical protein MBLNU13_g01875t1 [Cladosporium sp. NU13]
MDHITTEKGTYNGEQQQQGNCKDRNAPYEECCRDIECEYEKINQELRENVEEFCSLWKYHTHNEMMPRELYNFYNAVTTNKHEFLLLEKSLFRLQELEQRMKATMLGPKSVDAGLRPTVDWASKMPSNEPEINTDWSVY